MAIHVDHLTLVPVEDRSDDLEYAAYLRDVCGIDPLGLTNVVRLPVRPALRLVVGEGQ